MKQLSLRRLQDGIKKYNGSPANFMERIAASKDNGKSTKAEQRIAYETALLDILRQQSENDYEIVEKTLQEMFSSKGKGFGRKSAN